MVADAEANREEDKKFHELVQARNSADGLIHATRQAIKDHGSKVDGAQIGSIESALSDLENAMKGDDKAQVEAKTTALQTVAQSLFAAASAGFDPSAAADAAGAPGSAKADDVVDAEFTEVKNDK